MRKGKKILSMFMVLVLASACLIGCGGKEAGGNGIVSNKGEKDKTKAETTITIKYWNTGMGSKWLEQIAESFEEKYPKYDIKIQASASHASVVAAYGQEDIDDGDIYIINTRYDTTLMEPLDDVLDFTVEGESKSIREKYSAGYLQNLTSKDGHIYHLICDGGVMSFAYNKQLFEKAGIKQLPRTTDELTMACDVLSSKDITPLCHFKDGGYYHYMTTAIQAQYDGTDYYINNFYGCTDENGKSPSKAVFTAQDGRYYALRAYEKFLTAKYTLNGSNSKSHTEIQTEFIAGRAAMMLTGSWLENEMSTSNAQIDAFRIPVISAIVNKLSTVKYDTQLREVVSAVDQVLAGEKKAADFVVDGNYVIGKLTVSSADWDIIYNARSTSASNYAGKTIVIPNYAAEKEAAKEFLKYLYSDEGLTIYFDTIGCPLPISLSTGESFDKSELSEFSKKQFEIMEQSMYMADETILSAHRIFTEGGASSFAGVSYVNAFTTNNSADRLSANEIWDKVMKSVESKYDASWLKNMK